MDPRVVSCVVLLLAGVIFGGMAVLFIKRRIPPNAFVGIRVPKTYSNPAIWYKLHELFGYELLVASVTMVLVGIAIFVWRKEWSHEAVSVLFLIALVVPMVMAVIHSLWRLRKL